MAHAVVSIPSYALCLRQAAAFPGAEKAITFYSFASPGGLRFAVSSRATQSKVARSRTFHQLCVWIRVVLSWQINKQAMIRNPPIGLRVMALRQNHAKVLAPLFIILNVLQHLKTPSESLGNVLSAQPRESPQGEAPDEVQRRTRPKVVVSSDAQSRTCP